MKVQLIVVQGKPEGKVIPLTIPQFKIGRGETCHLRPNSEQVSREHAEFTISSDTVQVRDLGSRNGTLVNGKAVTEPYTLKDRDLVTIGHLTFAVSIEGAPAAKAAPAAPKPVATAKPAAIDDVSIDDIDSWLISDQAKPTPESPSGVYGGETITIAAFKDSAVKPEAAAPKPAPTADAAPDDGEFERVADEEEEQEPDDVEEDEDSDDGGAEDEMPEEFIDESNPFYVKKKKKEPEPTAKPMQKDSSDAASEILRKMVERRRAGQ